MNYLLQENIYERKGKAKVSGYHENKLVQRGQIVALRERGMSNCAIARELGVHPSTVAKWVNRQQETGRLVDLPREGRP